MSNKKVYKKQMNNEKRFGKLEANREIKKVGATNLFKYISKIK